MLSFNRLVFIVIIEVDNFLIFECSGYVRFSVSFSNLRMNFKNVKVFVYFEVFLYISIVFIIHCPAKQENCLGQIHKQPPKISFDSFIL